MNLYDIKDPSFLKDLSIKELEELAKDIRKFLIEKLSVTGGHLSGNLGAVDLTIALYKYFNNGERFIFDVGHQCLTHKILTGRSEDFKNFRKMDGLCAFPMRDESLYDVWEVAHSSTSLAAQAGLIEAGQNVISIIGDGALTGGEAIEGLEYLSTLNKKAIIILNDNSFSISKNVGFIRKMLDDLRSGRGYTSFASKHRNNLKLKSIKNSIKRLFYKTTVFDAMGFKYYGPINGHNFNEMFKYFEYANKQERPVILHIVTEKGKGYAPAENDKVGAWHCTNPFEIETGELKNTNNEIIPFSKAASIYLSKFYDKTNNLKVVMPAMTFPSNMVELKDHMKENFIDTGITEQFATSFSAALRLGGFNVCLPVYSSFLQRAYDQIHQDICMQNIPVVLMVDKAGIVPGNGKTHQGIYDISYLNTIPNLNIVAPKDMNELFQLFDYCFRDSKTPIAIHLPNNNTKLVDNLEPLESKIDLDHLWTIENNIENPKGYLITYSVLVDYIKDEVKDLGIEVINARFINPLDANLLRKIGNSDAKVFVYEEAPSLTSLASIITNFFNEENIIKHVYSFGFPLDYIHIGSIEELRKKYSLDKESIRMRIEKIL